MLGSLLALVLLTLPWVLMVAATLWMRRGGEVSPRNACVRCGYDFMALGRVEVCPECGMGRYDEPPRRVRWKRSAVALAVAFAPAAAVFLPRMKGLRWLPDVSALLEKLPEGGGGGGGAVWGLLLLAAWAGHGFVCWAILGPHARGMRERWIEGHVVGALAMLADWFAVVAMMLSTMR